MYPEAEFIPDSYTAGLFLSFAMLEQQWEVASQEGLCVILYKATCEGMSGTTAIYTGNT